MDKILTLFLGFGVIMGIFMTFILLRKYKQKSDLFLSGIILILSLIIFQNFLVFSGFEHHFPHLIFLFFPLNGLIGPLIYFFVVYYLDKNTKFRYVDLLHLLTFVAFLTRKWNYIFSSGHSKTIRASVVYSSEYTLDIYGILTYIAVRLVLIIYIFFALRKLTLYLKNNDKKLKSNQLKHLNKVRNFIIAFLLISIISFGIGLVFIAFDFSVYRLEMLLHLFNTLIIVYLSWTITSQSSYFVTDISPKTQNHLLKDKNGYILQVKKAMEIEKPFLNPELKLEDFSQQTNLSKQQISLALNHGLNQSFSEFVNEYRIEEFLKIMNSNVGKSQSIMAAAYESGFNSKSTFNRIFKKMYGISPSQYLHQTKN